MDCDVQSQQRHLGLQCHSVSGTKCYEPTRLERTSVKSKGLNCQEKTSGSAGR